MQFCGVAVHKIAHEKRLDFAGKINYELIQMYNMQSRVQVL